jgi:hypothetical protein
MNPQRLAMVPALILAGCVVAWAAGFDSAGM